MAVTDPGRGASRSTCAIIDADGDRARLLVAQLSATGKVVAALPGAGEREVDALLIVEPEAPEAVREAVARSPAGERRPTVVVALSPEESRNATAFFAAGADDVVWLPVRVDEVVLRLSLWHQKSGAEREAERLRALVGSRLVSDALVGESPAMREVFTVLERVARNDASVLIRGETGTGKEMVARAIHLRSERRAGPFVALNLSAVPKDLVESELFGHAAGAFTGARGARDGRLEAATGGTLFLDEIGDLPEAVQVKLLRVLQERTYERVGENRGRPTDFRLICATHRDLEQSIEEGRFREDLYYRLDVVQVVLPPLRERGADVLLLADHFLRRSAERFGLTVQLGEAARQALRAHHWPGNVRELQHTIERSVALAQDGDVIGPELVRPRKRRGPLASLTTEIIGEGRGLDEALAQIERSVLQHTLERCGGNQSKAAEMLRLPRQTLQNRLKKYGLV